MTDTRAAGSGGGGVPDFSRPPVIGADAGLDAAWLAGGNPAEVAAALAPYLSNTVPADAESLAIWEANGLRAVRVPLADWARLATELRISSASQRQWLGPSGEWAEIVRGVDESRGQIIALDAERVELGPGALRLLGRCWVTPVPGETGPSREGAASGGARAELSVELLPQLHEARGREARGPSVRADDRLTPAIDRGLTFTRIGLRFRVRNEGVAPSVILVLAERPGADWLAMSAPPPPPADTGPPAEDRAAPGVGEVVRNGDHKKREPQARADPRAGPRAPLLRTLGEAMFRAPLPPMSHDEERLASAQVSVRAILALVPYVPAEYNLIPAAPRRAASGAR